jgi:hypothetical protein
MVDPTKITAELSAMRADFPFRLDTQKQTARFFADVSDLTSKTMRGILESQTELMQLEAHQAFNSFLLPKAGEEPSATFCSYWHQLHEQSDRVIAQTRHLNDVLRDYTWGLLELYANSYSKSIANAAQNAGTLNER